MLFKAYSVGKLRQLVINKHMNDSKKVMRAGKRIFLDLETIKVPQDSEITITRRKWHIVVNQYTVYKELEFNSTKGVFMELTYKKFSKWKNNGKLVSYIRHDNAPENKIFIKIANDLQ